MDNLRRNKNLRVGIILVLLVIAIYLYFTI